MSKPGMQEQFEKWGHENFGYVHLPLGDQYLRVTEEIAWQAWQIAYRAGLERAAEIAEEIVERYPQSAAMVAAAIRGEKEK